MISERIAELKQQLAGGVSPAMATPLVPETYTVNPAGVLPLADFLIDAGVKGLFVGGTTGEGTQLDADQRQALHEAAVAAAAGRVPVLLHVGAQRTDVAVALARHAATLQPAAIVAMTPTFYTLSDDALARYYHTIAEAAPDIPLFLYDIPQFAVNGIGPALLARLARELPSLAGMKTSRVDIQFVRQLIDAMPRDRILLAGNESAALGSLALGADGLISGLSTAIPEPFVALTRAAAAGRLAEARDWQRCINQLLALLAGARLGGIKAILNQRDIEVGPPTPLLDATDALLWPQAADILGKNKNPQISQITQI
ncbi:dihydrodipicolinate synthase family protein [Promineifilum sp.]|uniref:dihydrodipicolinate synthase family protein n=1 Tax=Promineifilum sp. TaxID=2664178 RepID=UPI0035B2A31E